MKRVVVVLPTYNEKNNIIKFAQTVIDQEKSLPGYEIHVLIADDVRTSDGTEEAVKELIKKEKKIHFMKTEPGLGVALITAHQYALANLKPDVLAQIDADAQVEVDVIPKLVKAIEEGYTLAIGSRFVKGGKNNLSLTRKIFSAGASWVYRILVGPIGIKEVTNSARAFTPGLFKKINLKRLPWREQTFIVQPAFLNEAILAGARYKEVPLIFKNRSEGYSKNKTINYTYDVITYSLDARLHKWGIDVPFFQLTRKAKTIIKFGVVGFTGTFVDFLFYKFFIWNFHLEPPNAKIFSTIIAIQNNFLLNNFWTFKNRKTTTSLGHKIVMFNLVSSGGVLISFFVVYILHRIFGDGMLYIGSFHAAYNNFYFFATIPPVMIWNFAVNHFITWKHEED